MGLLDKLFKRNVEPSQLEPEDVEELQQLSPEAIKQAQKDMQGLGWDMVEADLFDKIAEQILDKVKDDRIWNLVPHTGAKHNGGSSPHLKNSRVNAANRGVETLKQKFLPNDKVISEMVTTHNTNHILIAHNIRSKGTSVGSDYPDQHMSVGLYGALYTYRFPSKEDFNRARACTGRDDKTKFALVLPDSDADRVGELSYHEVDGEYYAITRHVVVHPETKFSKIKATTWEKASLEPNGIGDRTKAMQEGESAIPEYVEGMLSGKEYDTGTLDVEALSQKALRMVMNKTDQSVDDGTYYRLVKRLLYDNFCAKCGINPVMGVPFRTVETEVTHELQGLMEAEYSGKTSESTDRQFVETAKGVLQAHRDYLKEQEDKRVTSIEAAAVAKEEAKNKPRGSQGQLDLLEGLKAFEPDLAN